MRSQRWGWSTCVRMIRRGCPLMLRSRRSAWQLRLAPEICWACYPTHQALGVVELGVRAAVAARTLSECSLILTARRLKVDPSSVLRQSTVG